MLKYHSEARSIPFQIQFYKSSIIIYIEVFALLCVALCMACRIPKGKFSSAPLYRKEHSDKFFSHFVSCSHQAIIIQRPIVGSLESFVLLIFCSDR